MVKNVVMPIALALLLVPDAAIPLNARAQGGVDPSLFFSVLDAAGKPVKDIVADDILIREDGVDRHVVTVKPASQPISVAVLVDTRREPAKPTSTARRKNTCATSATRSAPSASSCSARVRTRSCR